MNLKNFLNKKIIVKQIKGGSKLNDRQKSTIIGLGLRGIGSQSELFATHSIIGMIKKVAQIVKITN
jgi:large subunit ribosomal protein L30